MKKRLKIFLVSLLITIVSGVAFGVLFGFGLAILYDDTRTAFIHGMIAGLASAIILAVYIYVSGILRNIILKYMDSSDVDEL